MHEACFAVQSAFMSHVSLNWLLYFEVCYRSFLDFTISQQAFLFQSFF
jgi:hypothetical protein